MVIPPNMVIIGFDPSPYLHSSFHAYEAEAFVLVPIFHDTSLGHVDRVTLRRNLPEYPEVESKGKSTECSTIFNPFVDWIYIYIYMYICIIYIYIIIYKSYNHGITCIDMPTMSKPAQVSSHSDSCEGSEPKEIHELSFHVGIENKDLA